ncbi:MAG: zinc ribbon domain-containing protein [Candidatus Thorarchaeota archaeon]|nr:zinc ribbon domain-containing protein [Candidatus Thorarchaeota archaeon]
MGSCKACGAKIGGKDRSCPKCGTQATSPDEGKTIRIENLQDGYVVERTKDDATYLRFGDGKAGVRLPFCGSVGTTYRFGMTASPNMYAKHIEQHWEHLDHHLDMVPITSSRHASKGLGQILLESMSTIGNLLSCYQDVETDGAQFNTEEQQRISGLESKIQSKLRTLVAFCDTTDEKAQSELGLTESDVRRLRSSALAVLGIIAGVESKCPGCGTEISSTSVRCSNCGAVL